MLVKTKNQTMEKKDKAASLYHTAAGERKGMLCLRTLAVLIILVPLSALCLTTTGQSADINKKLKGFDQYMEKTLKNWNTPGACVGIVVKDRLVFARGYGYRDYGKKLPVTPNTLYQIASNTKLFTTVAAGLLVEEGKLEWDLPVKNFVPTIKFYNNDLDNTVTIHDMLAHRTGISRHDMIWYKSDFTRKDLFDRLKYLEPSQPLRTGFLYNNLMYVSAGYIIELLSGKTWEQFVQERIFDPLGMSRTFFAVSEMTADPDHGVPYNEKRDTTILNEIPIYEDKQAVGPAGSVISNINDMSKWLIALMNGGRYEGKQVIPEAVLKATLAPSIAMPNTGLDNKGYTEILNSVYGMGRWTTSYKGHLMAYHGGDLPGFHSQISMMPTDSIGVIVFVIGDQSSPLYNIITYNIYERLLGMDLTPWSERALADRDKAKAAGREGRSKAGADRIEGTVPSHKLEDYAGEYEHPAYGIMKINLKYGDSLQFDFHNIVLPLSHYHYDRFDSPNDEEYGLWSLNFMTDPSGAISSLVVSLDEGQVTFTRRADPGLSDPAVLLAYEGKYTMGGTIFSVELVGNEVFLVIPGNPKYRLIPVSKDTFRIQEFADIRIIFARENDVITGFKMRDPSGEYMVTKQ
jgi:CubicO group peptidase (beta-lactamase class C family)